ncbi:MAG: tetratricopeptide repeat protein, partial [Rhodanobacteraceae bacterium]
GLVKSLRNLAIAQAVKGDRDAARANLDKARVLLEGIGDRASLAELYNDRGVVAEEQGDFGDALARYREALAIRQQLDLPVGIAESANNVAYASYQLGQFDNAFAFWQQSLALYQSLDDRNKEIAITQNLALLDVARGHFAAARERMQSSLQTAESSQLVEESAVAHTNLAELALLEGAFGDAIDHADRAEEAFRRRSDQRGEIEANLIRARIALALGDVAACDRALEAIPSDADISGEQRAGLLLASARRAYLGGDAAAGAAKLAEAATTAADAHAGVLAFRIGIERARRALQAGQTAQASAELAALHKETTLLGQVPLRLDLAELEIASSLRSGRNGEAAGRYRETLPLLREAGRYAYSTTLHALGARALPPGAEATAAASAAASARDQVIADAPTDAKASLQQQLDLRLLEGGDAR